MSIDSWSSSASKGFFLSKMQSKKMFFLQKFETKKRNCSICNVPKWRSGNCQARQKNCKIKKLLLSLFFPIHESLAHSGSANKGKISYQLKSKLFYKREDDEKEKKMSERRKEFTPPTISSNQVKVPLKPGRGLSNWMRFFLFNL